MNNDGTMEASMVKMKMSALIMVSVIKVIIVVQQW